MSNKKQKRENQIKEIYIPPEKIHQIIDDLRLFQASYKNGIPKY